MEKDKSEIKWTPRAKMLAKIGKVALAGGALTGGYAWANAGQQSPNLSHDPKVEVVISPEIPTIDAAATYANGGYMGAALRNAEIEYLDAENVVQGVFFPVLHQSDLLSFLFGIER